jgi:hypothetical protein
MRTKHLGLAQTKPGGQDPVDSSHSIAFRAASIRALGGASGVLLCQVQQPRESDLGILSSQDRPCADLG